MGTSMASVSFRQGDTAKWPDLKPKIMEMYQGVEGLVSNLEQEQKAYAIVSPYGDLGMFMQDFPEAISRLTGDYAIFCVCVDSDFALLELYYNGQLVEKTAVGELDFLAEIDELAELKAPDITLWKPLLRNIEGVEALQNAFTETTGFVEDQLREISALIGIPVFDDELVYGEDF